MDYIRIIATTGDCRVPSILQEESVKQFCQRNDDCTIENRTALASDRHMMSENRKLEYASGLIWRRILSKRQDLEVNGNVGVIKARLVFHGFREFQTPLRNIKEALN